MGLRATVDLLLFAVVAFYKHLADHELRKWKKSRGHKYGVPLVSDGEGKKVLPRRKIGPSMKPERG